MIAVHPQPIIWMRMVVRRILDYPHPFRLTLNGHGLDADDNKNIINDDEHLLFENGSHLAQVFRRLL